MQNVPNDSKLVELSRSQRWGKNNSVIRITLQIYHVNI